MGEQFPLINPSFDFVPLFTGLRQRSIRNEITPQRYLHQFVRKELNHFPSREKVCGLVTSQVQSVATHVTATSHSCDASARLIILKNYDWSISDYGKKTLLINPTKRFAENRRSFFEFKGV